MFPNWLLWPSGRYIFGHSSLLCIAVNVFAAGIVDLSCWYTFTSMGLSDTSKKLSIDVSPSAGLLAGLFEAVLAIISVTFKSLSSLSWFLGTTYPNVWFFLPSSAVELCIGTA